MKQILRSILLALMAILVPLMAQAYDFEVDGIFYNINGNEATVTYDETYTHQYGGNVNIPATVTYEGQTYNVTAIGMSAFERCWALESVSIPNSVTTIGRYAFSNCDALTTIDIPNSVTILDASAFYGCTGLTSVFLSDYLTSI